jgi:hypothetical protein
MNRKASNGTLLTLLLGTALLLLGFFLFPSGLIGTFFSLSEYATNPAHILDIASGNANPEQDVKNVIVFIVEIGLYYLAAAILVFVFDLFMPKKK